MTGIVIDASLVLAWLNKDERTPDLIALGRRIMSEGAIAPTFLALEVANGLVSAERRNRAEVHQVHSLLKRFFGFPINLVPVDQRKQLDEVIVLSRAHRLTAYDASYLELAQRMRASLATLDADLRKAAIASGVPVLP